MHWLNRIARVVLALLVVLLASLIVALVINLALFRFGPWADVWVEQTWFGLALAGGPLAFLMRRRWMGTAG